MPSVNEVTDKTISPAHSMAELGNVLPCIIYAVRIEHESKGPILFSKLDIKDGYWRMVVPAEDECNFAYVLPKANPQVPMTYPCLITNGLDRQSNFLWQCIRNGSWFCCNARKQTPGIVANAHPGTIPDANGKLLHPNIGSS